MTLAVLLAVALQMAKVAVDGGYNGTVLAAAAVVVWP